MSGELPTNTGFDPTSIKGEGGVSVRGAGNVVVSTGGPGGAGGVIQEVFGQFQTRPTTLSQASPGGPYVTLLTVPITTGPLGRALDVTATLSGQTELGGGGTNVAGAIRVLIDGVSSGLGSAQRGSAAGEGSRAFSVAVQVRAGIAPPVLPATTVVHNVELQWRVFGDGVDPNPQIEIVMVDADGASMTVRELSGA